ncbi:glycoside hydrolase family 6 protein [Dactylosporangium sp. NBC_01737]|uniref:glycoside hydrolase family 6 protein n=1 Tax=Dactylosporangium sp. NBC_01737 TaxID=2975959 RepID=UPI002E1633C7|nr:glycoside hydrolase family 6 protein [Dactylosporangium sp. NBC_01737]
MARPLRSLANVGVMLAISFVAVAVTSGGAAQADTQLCDTFGSTTIQDRYIVMNNRWGADTAQCINVTDHGFAVTADHHKQTNGAPASYTAVYSGCHYNNCSPGTNLPMQVSQISSATSSVAFSYPDSGVYNASYDIWLDPTPKKDGANQQELMIWFNHSGPIHPVGSKVASATVGGRAWDVWTGNNGSNDVISYVARSPINSWDFSVLDFVNDTKTRGKVTDSWYLTSIQAGFEPWVGGTGLAVTSFAASVSGGGGSTPPVSPPSPTTAPSTTAPPTTPPSTGSPSPGTHVDNPYVGAKGYVNPEWKAKANAEPGGSRISNNPTGVWLDRIAAISGVNGGMGVRAHLDAALAQGAGYIQFVIYNLPGRDCAALASNGELGPTEIDRYQTDYIDPIAAIQADPKYRNLRIINIIEVDSLPNMVTNTSGASATAMCQTMQQNGNYQKGVSYALSKFHSIANVYNYIDAAHHGWIGHSSNFGRAADLFATVAKSATGGLATVDGFITDTANYSALTEPYVKIDTTVNGTSVRQSKWVDWNDYVDELTFAQAFRNKLISNGFSPSIGMLIDTSRNGWGGPNRPTGPSTSTDINTFVNQSRVDRRIQAGNWCNQSGAGLGERPKAAPAQGIDAYVWIKPPGESDGASEATPNGQGKGLDQMCDPKYTGNAGNGNNLTGALPNAPLSGNWFPAQFQELMRNAYPTLS